MKQTTSKLLYQYWNSLRRGRLAPRRFEIEPARIAPLLPETFIVECAGFLSFRFRLAGTRICEQFGRELRGTDFLDLWTGEDRDSIAGFLRAAVGDGAVGIVHFEGRARNRRKVAFEMLLLPLVHTGNTVNRLLGSVSALENPYWLGANPIDSFARISLESWQPEPPLPAAPQSQAAGANPAQPRLKVLQGGLAEGE